MIRRSIATLVIALLVMLIPGEADAKRGDRISIPIPGLRSQRIIKVLDLPREPQLRRADGNYVDLGYLFHSWSGGEWVGYTGSDKSYLPLDSKQLQALLQASSVRELPPVPERPWSIDELFWMVIGIVGVISVAFFQFLKRAGALEDDPAGAAGRAAPVSQGAAVAAAARPSAPPSSARQRRFPQAAGGAPTFGKRV